MYNGAKNNLRNCTIPLLLLLHATYIRPLKGLIRPLNGLYMPFKGGPCARALKALRSPLWSCDGPRPLGPPREPEVSGVHGSPGPPRELYS